MVYLDPCIASYSKYICKCFLDWFPHYWKTCQVLAGYDFVCVGLSTQVWTSFTYGSLVYWCTPKKPQTGAGAEDHQWCSIFVWFNFYLWWMETRNDPAYSLTVFYTLGSSFKMCAILMKMNIKSSHVMVRKHSSWWTSWIQSCWSLVQGPGDLDCTY